ncbi:MAG: cyclic nucleotide-binding domain-containing protein [Thermodesulfobacteriota bacterium]
MAVNVEYTDTVPVITGTEDHFAYVVSEDGTYEGDDVVKEGKAGNWLCIVLEGHADIVRETPKGPVRIVRLGPGAMVGSMASMYTVKSHRSATLIARAGLVLGTLNIQRIHPEFQRISPDLHNIVLGLDKRLKEVTQRVVDTHLGQLNLNDFTRDKKLVVKQGTADPKLSFITEGSVAVVQTRQKGHIPLATLAQNDFIGPLPFADMGHEPAAASVLASADCKTAPVDVEALKMEFQQASVMVKAFVEHVAACIRATTSLAGEPEKIAAAQKG